MPRGGGNETVAHTHRSREARSGERSERTSCTLVMRSLHGAHSRKPAPTVADRQLRVLQREKPRVPIKSRPRRLYRHCRNQGIQSAAVCYSLVFNRLLPARCIQSLPESLGVKLERFLHVRPRSLGALFPFFDLLAQLLTGLHVNPRLKSLTTLRIQHFYL